MGDVPGKKLVGMAGIGISSVVPQVGDAKSSAIVGASYPLGADDRVLDFTSYGSCWESPEKQYKAGLRCKFV